MSNGTQFAKQELIEDRDTPSLPRRSLRLKIASQPPEKTIPVKNVPLMIPVKRSVPLRLYPELDPPRKRRLQEVYHAGLEKWKKYTDQLKESQGFDVSTLKEIPNTSGTFGFPVIESSFYLTHPGQMGLKYKSFAEKALEIYNNRYKCHPPWELHKVVRLNRGGCMPMHWYYTIEAKRGEGAPKTFQAKVLEYLGGRAEFPIIRREKEKKVGQVGEKTASSSI